MLHRFLRKMAGVFLVGILGSGSITAEPQAVASSPEAIAYQAQISELFKSRFQKAEQIMAVEQKIRQATEPTLQAQKDLLNKELDAALEKEGALPNKVDEEKVAQLLAVQKQIDRATDPALQAQREQLKKELDALDVQAKVLQASDIGQAVAKEMWAKMSPEEQAVSDQINEKVAQLLVIQKQIEMATDPAVIEPLRAKAVLLINELKPLMNKMVPLMNKELNSSMGQSLQQTKP